MANFTDIVDNSYLTALDGSSQISLESINRSTIIQANEPAYPTPETISKYGLNITFGTWKMGGSTGITGKENQDACSVITGTINEAKYTIVCVCDGHGLHGQTFANSVASILPQFVVKQMNQIISDPVTNLKNIFEQVTGILKNKFSSGLGGTTATIGILFDGCFISANVGDCEALIKLSVEPAFVQCETNGILIPTKIIDGVIRTTCDHNCKNMLEVERVLNAGAMVKYATQARVHEINVYTPVIENGTISYVHTPHSKQKGGFVSNMSKDPAIYFHANGEKINMTRAIGDWSCEFLLAEPDVTRVIWPQGTKARLLVASDGYFNSWSDQDQINQMDFNVSAEEICMRGYEQVGKIFSHTHADNTTIVIVDN